MQKIVTIKTEIVRMILSKRKLKINSKVTYSKIIKMYRPVLQLLVSPTLIGFSNMKLIEKCVVSVLLNSLLFSSTLKKEFIIFLTSIVTKSII